MKKIEFSIRDDTDTKKLLLSLDNNTIDFDPNRDRVKFVNEMKYMMNLYSSHPDYLEAENLLSVGKFIEAKKICENILSEDPEFLLSFYALGVIYTETGDYEKAIEYLKKVEKLSKASINSAHARLIRANAEARLAQSINKISPNIASRYYSNAEKLYDETLFQTKPQLTIDEALKTINNYGVLSLLQGKFTKAYDLFSLTLKIIGEYPQLKMFEVQAKNAQELAKKYLK